jgi:Tfp pilus assembly protein PilX
MHNHNRGLDVMNKRKNIKLSYRTIKTEKGFALVAAILACLILMALAMLVIHLSTQDLRISTRVVGEKKAMSAAETGIHQLIINFNPQNLAASAVTDVAADAVNAPGDFYTIGLPTLPTAGPAFLPLIGFAVGGGQSWGQRCYAATVTGTNTNYNSRMVVGVGIGFGPIEISTMSR